MVICFSVQIIRVYTVHVVFSSNTGYQKAQRNINRNDYYDYGGTVLKLNLVNIRSVKDRYITII